LTRISISNYLLIDELELPFGKGLTTITGETGSGKSILIGAIGLAMGERADAGLARDPRKRCVIELHVDVRGAGVEAWCEPAGVPFETETIIRRQLDPGGRSRAFINDTPVRLEQLRELGERLVHVHSQHHNLLLNDPRFQLGLVDHAAGHTRVVSAYRTDFRAWKTLADELARIREEEARSRTELDYLQFQLDELDQAQLKDGEQEGLEQDLQRAEHAGEILQGLQAAESAITAERGLISTLAALRVQLAKAARHDTAVNTLLERLNSVGIELKDIGAEADTMAAGTSLDPREEQRLRERLDTLLRLQQKHRVRDTASLIALAADLRERTQRIGSMAARIAELEAEERAIHQNVMTQAKQISDTRRKAMPALASEVADLLKQLGMPHARFVFDHHTTEPGPQGIDVVRALFSANKDRAPEAMDKVASGGELSRLMLALISLSAENLGLPTVIFDEIDTGVSGEVADRVGSLMARMARDRQIIAITHLPQIASKAHMHLLVSKDHEAEQVTTHIRPLAHEERVHALAQMLSGKKTTKAALDNARELLKGG
jgi:DNA repair protein RecN (Recombination protein N)